MAIETKIRRFIMVVQYYSNAAGIFQKREIFPADTIPGAITAQPAKEASTGHIYGFGVAITPASCYLLAQMGPEKRTAFLEHIYGRNGLNLSVGRLCVGSSDYSAELYTYDDVPFDTELKHFSVERDEKYVIPMIKEILKIRPDLYLYASPWSPPGWMKTGGSICGGHMREEFIDCYADYYIKYLQAYAAHGIHIQALTPQNEPETHQSGKMPACIWHPELEAKFVKILRAKLDELKMDVKIWLWDYRFTGIDRVLWSLDTIEGLADCCAGVAFHYYAGDIERTLPLRDRYSQLELHFTEGGPRLYDHYDTDWCKWAIMITKALTCGYRSFTGWNLLLDETGGPNIGPYFCGGLATLHSITGELCYSGQSIAIQHIAPYITPTSRIYPLITDEAIHSPMFGYPNTKELMVGFLIENGENTVCVMVNPDKGKKQVRFFAKDRWWYAEILSDSISTIIL